MHATTYRVLNRGPIEDRVKVVLDALGSHKWHIQEGDPAEGEKHWLVNIEGEAPGVVLPQDIIDYITVQNLLCCLSEQTTRH